MTRQTKLTPRQIEIVKAFADHDMVTSAAARALHYSSCGLRYQLGRIHSLTGLNPMRFYDLQKLLLMEVEE